MKPKSQYLKKGQKQNRQEKKRLARLQYNRSGSSCICGTISPELMDELANMECAPCGPPLRARYYDHPKDRRVLISHSSGLIAVGY